MKNLITKGLTKSFEISIVIKNNIAQILIAAALFVLCCGIAISFILGSSTITVKTEASRHKDHSDKSVAMPILLSHQTLFEFETNKPSNIPMEIKNDKR